MTKWGFVILADHSVKIKENEKRQVLRPCQRTKKLWNMKVTLRLIVIGTLGMISKGFVRGLKELKTGEGTEIIQITALLRSTQNTEKSPGDLLSLKLHWKTISSRWWEKPARNNDDDDFVETGCHSDSCESLPFNTGVKSSQGVK